MYSIISLLPPHVQVMVPVQAAIVLSILHFLGPDLNNFVHGWTQDDFVQAMQYILADLAVEISIFLTTLVVLWLMCQKLQSESHASVIICALMTQNFSSMAVLFWATWSLVLGFQYTHGGMDLEKFQFQWLDCPNGTWAGAFEWEGCE